MRRPKEEEVKCRETIIKMIKEGEKIERIYDETGASYSTIMNYRKELGVTRVNQSANAKKKMVDKELKMLCGEFEYYAAPIRKAYKTGRLRKEIFLAPSRDH